MSKPPVTKVKTDFCKSFKDLNEFLEFGFFYVGPQQLGNTIHGSPSAPAIVSIGNRTAIFGNNKYKKYIYIVDGRNLFVPNRKDAFSSKELLAVKTDVKILASMPFVANLLDDKRSLYERITNIENNGAETIG